MARDVAALLERGAVGKERFGAAKIVCGVVELPALVNVVVAAGAFAVVCECGKTAVLVPFAMDVHDGRVAMC